MTSHPFHAQCGHRRCVLFVAKRPMQTVPNISCARCSRAPALPRGTWKDTASPNRGHRPSHHAGTAHHRTAPSVGVLTLTNEERGRNSGCHEWECPKETPGGAERKVIKIILMPASCCFRHSGRGMSLGWVILPKCCQRHSRHHCYSPGPHQRRVHFVTALISEPVLTGGECLR